MLFPLELAVLLGAAADAVALVATPPAAAADDADATGEETTAVPLAAADETPEDVELAPVAAIRCSRSACVVHVMLVPAELTRGRAAQLG